MPISYDNAVAETARLTVVRPELDEQEQWAINERLAYIAIISTNNPMSASSILSPMTAKAAGQLLRLPVRSKKYLPQTEQSSWQMDVLFLLQM